MKMRKLLILSASTLLSFVFLFVVAGKVMASEGTFEMESTTRDNFRCFAASLLLENRKYKIIITCRNLIYPPNEELFTYMLWANSAADDKNIKLGSLGIGKATFDTTKPFNRLFVTIEKDKRVRSPSGEIVMSGNLKKLEFLENIQSPTPTTEAEGDEVEEEVASDEPEQPLSTRDKLLTGLRRAGLIAFFALVALIGLIFVVSRSRG
jgi:hypothetical protein